MRRHPFRITTKLGHAEIAQRVEALRVDRFFPMRSKLDVDVATYDLGGSIHLFQVVGRNLSVELTAELESDGTNTIVRGTTAVTRASQVMTAIIGGVILFVMSVVAIANSDDGPSAWLGIPFVAMVLVILMVYADSRSRQLAEMLSDEIDGQIRFEPSRRRPD